MEVGFLTVTSWTVEPGKQMVYPVIRVRTPIHSCKEPGEKKGKSLKHQCSKDLAPDLLSKSAVNASHGQKYFVNMRSHGSQHEQFSFYRNAECNLQHAQDC